MKPSSYPRVVGGKDYTSDDLSTADSQQAATGGSGDGGGPTDETEQRVASLEADRKAIFSKLDDISQKIDDQRSDNDKRFAAIETRLGTIDANLESKASGEQLAKIGGDLALKVQAVEKDLATKASTGDMRELKGSVDRLPTNLSFFLGLGSFIIAVFVAAGVAKHFGW